MTEVFSKYRTRGAYHWDHISKLPWRHHCFTAARYALILDMARVKSEEHLLDVGCGDGALLYLCSRTGATCIGVEPNTVGRTLAQAQFKRRGVPALIVRDVSEIPDESQDVVICAEVIEHVSDARGLIGEIKRVLKSGGRLVLSTPIRVTETPLDSEHIHEYYPSEVVDLVTSMLRIIEARQELPVFGVELYYWRPWCFVALPVTKYIMNILSAWFGYSVMRHSGRRYPTVQAIIALKD